MFTWPLINESLKIVGRIRQFLQTWHSNCCQSSFAWNKTEINWPVGHDGQEGCILNSLTSPAAYHNEIHCTPGISQTRKTQPYIIIPSVINSKLQHPSPPSKQPTGIWPLTVPRGVVQTIYLPLKYEIEHNNIYLNCCLLMKKMCINILYSNTWPLSEWQQKFWQKEYLSWANQI